MVIPNGTAITRDLFCSLNTHLHPSILRINPLPLRGRVGERGSERYNIEQTPLDYPLILAFSRSTQRTSIKEKGCIF
jgi:hypothetical protein